VIRARAPLRFAISGGKETATGEGSMEIAGQSLDEVLMELYGKLLSCGSRNEGSRGGTLELLGVSLRISKPRARLSRSENRGKPFSALGELLWYLARSDKLEFIEQYVPRYKEDAVDGILEGAYGPRLFEMRGGINQIANVTELLRERATSRRAVVQLFNAEDIASEHKEIPCTTTMQFHLRDKRLHMSATLRSNDAYWGLPHDVFCFTMLQEMMACRLGVELGEYYQYVGSMHVYDKYVDKLPEYIDEGFHKVVEMPIMPPGDPFELTELLLQAEGRVRIGEQFAAETLISEPYWADIIRLLQVFWASGNEERLDVLKAQFVNPLYRSYLEGRRYMKRRGPKDSV
jgi:thymidylate synthase